MWRVEKQESICCSKKYNYYSRVKSDGASRDESGLVVTKQMKNPVVCHAEKFKTCSEDYRV